MTYFISYLLNRPQRKSLSARNQLNLTLSQSSSSSCRRFSSISRSFSRRLASLLRLRLRPRRADRDRVLERRFLSLRRSSSKSAFAARSALSKSCSTASKSRSSAMATEARRPTSCPLKEREQRDGHGSKDRHIISNRYLYMRVIRSSPIYICYDMFL